MIICSWRSSQSVLKTKLELFSDNKKNILGSISPTILPYFGFHGNYCKCVHGYHIATKFCTCRDSTAVMWCAKLHNEVMTSSFGIGCVKKKKEFELHLKSHLWNGPQGSIYACAQPMRDGFTLKYCLPLAGLTHLMIPGPLSRAETIHLYTGDTEATVHITIRSEDDTIRYRTVVTHTKVRNGHKIPQITSSIFQ